MAVRKSICKTVLCIYIVISPDIWSPLYQGNILWFCLGFHVQAEIKGLNLILTASIKIYFCSFYIFISFETVFQTNITMFLFRWMKIQIRKGTCVQFSNDGFIWNLSIGLLFTGCSNNRAFAFGSTGICGKYCQFARWPLMVGQ